MKIMQRMFLMFGFASIFFAYQFDAISADRRVVSRAGISVPTIASTTNKTNINQNIFVSCTNGKIYCAPGKYIASRITRSCNVDCEPGYACSGGCISTSFNSNFGRTRCTGRDYSAGTNQAKCEKCPANAKLITDIKTGLNTGCVYPTEPINGNGNNGSGTGNAGREDGLQYYTAIYDCGEASSLAGSKVKTVQVGFNETFTVADVKDVCDLPAKKEFLNWKIDGTNTTVKSGGQIKWIWKENKKIVAQWKDRPGSTGGSTGGSTNTTRTITYYGVSNTDTWTGNKPGTYTVGVGVIIGHPNNRANEDFAGWCVNTSGCSNYANYVNGYTISATQTGNITMYAKWQEHTSDPEIKKYTVTYRTGECTGYNADYIVYTDPNASNNGGYSVPSAANSAINNLINENKFVFKGWNTNSGQTSVNFPEGWVPDHDVNVYAVCVEKDNPDVDVTYTITYRCGSCGSLTCQDRSDMATADQDYTIPDSVKEYMENHIKSGYTFTGWNTQPGKTESDISSWTPTEDRTIYVACSNDADVTTYHCLAGQYLPAKGNQCRDCEKGYKCPATEKDYQKQNYPQGRTKCNGNTFTNLTGQTECQVCNGTLEVVSGANEGCDSTDPEGCNVKYTCYGGNVLTTQAVSTNSFTITTAVCPSIFDGQTFKGWNAPNGDVVVANDSYTCTNSDIEFTAEYNQSSAGGCIVTYDCNNIGSNQGIVEPSGTGTFSVKGENVCSNIPDNKELAYWVPSDNVNAKISGGTTYSCGNQTSLTFTAHWRNKTTNPTFVEGVSVTCGEGEWLPNGKSECYDCGDNPDYFCPGGTYKTSTSKYKGIYECLNGGTQNSAGTGCTVKFDANDLLYGIGGDANCWLEKDATDYKNCVFGGAQKAR